MPAMSICAMTAILTVATVVGLVSADATPYDDAMGRLALYYSAAVKCHPGTNVQNWTCGPACDRAGPLTNITFTYHDSMEVRSFVGYDPSHNQVVISFRGSETLLNWLEDFEVTLTPYTSHPLCGGDCKVHRGFYQTYMFLAQTVVPAATALLNAMPSASLLITGHSLGAAQAQLAFLDLIAVAGSARTVTVITFGCPRVGNSAFANWAEGQVQSSTQYAVYRLVHDNDPVTMIPFTFMGYQHFPRDFVWFAPSVPAPGWVWCNRTGMQTMIGNMAARADFLKERQMLRELGLSVPAAVAALKDQPLSKQLELAELAKMKRQAAGKTQALFLPPLTSSTCGGSIWHLNLTDHFNYLGLTIDCDLK